MVSEEDIAEVVSDVDGHAGAQASPQEETERLLHMEDALHNRVIGQEEAITAIAGACAAPRRPEGPEAAYRLALSSSARPASGKTELAKALAEFMFGSEDMMIKHRHVRIYGTARRLALGRAHLRGMSGYEEGGQLTEPCRRRPYSVVLLDEIEKAHPEVFNILLQILEDGS